MIILLLLVLNGAVDDPVPSTTRGKLKPAEVVNLAEGRRAILVLVPEGTVVKKGQVVAELDSAAFREQLANQQIATRLAQGQFEIAKTHREALEKTHGLLPTTLAKETNRAENYVELGKAMVVEADRRVWEVDQYLIVNKKMWAANKKTIADETLTNANVGSRR